MNSLGVHGKHGRQNWEVGYQHRMTAKGEEISLATPYLTESMFSDKSGNSVLNRSMFSDLLQLLPLQSHWQSSPLCLITGSELEQASSEQ